MKLVIIGGVAGGASAAARARRLDEKAEILLLERGAVVVCIMGPGDFTTSGHFIVLAGITDDGMAEVRDPNSAERSAQAWDLGRVLGQCANLWALST